MPQQSPFRKLRNALIFMNKNRMSQYTYFEDIYTDSTGSPMLVFLPSITFCIEIKSNFVNQSKEKITLKIFPWGRMS